jgi:3-phenylpropionate/cinnamic acid dioxygenase small subunit
MIRDLAFFQLQEELAQFLYDEADLLDRRRFREWLDMLADDLAYVMPLRRNVPLGAPAAAENTESGRDILWFDEDKWTLGKRVEQIMTGFHWAEEPLSRVTHMVTNVQLLDAQPSAAAATEATVRSRFLVYQNRAADEAYFFVGKRTDTLRRAAAGWQLARREILLDQNVLLAKNLTVFF